MENEQIQKLLHHGIIAEEPSFQYEIMKDPEQRMLLAQSVDRLLDDTKRTIHTHTEGKDTIEKESAPCFVFLDKSARPVSTLFLDLWKKKFPEYPSPDVRFINVGKETAERFKNILGNDYIKLPSPWESNFNEEYHKLKTVIESISPEKIKTEIMTEQEVELLKKIGEGRKELVLVEEYTETGESLLWAKKLLRSVNSDLMVSSKSLATHKDKLFELARGNGGESIHTPPWRKIATDAEYGITGVIDSASLFAEPWHAHKDDSHSNEVKTLRSQKEAHLNQFIKHFHDAWTEENSKNLMMRLKDLQDGLGKLSLKDTDDQENREILKQAVHGIIVSVNVVQEMVAYTDIHPEADTTRLLFDTARSFVGAIKSAQTELNKINSVTDQDFFDLLSTSSSFFRKISTNFGKRESLDEINENEAEIQEFLRGENLARSVRGLRNEMHAIADEYWQGKEDSK